MSKTVFSIESFKQGDYVVCCSTMDQWIEFLSYLERKTNLIWQSGHLPTEGKDYWHYYGADTIIGYNRGLFYGDGGVEDAPDYLMYGDLTFYSTCHQYTGWLAKFRKGKLAVECQNNKEVREFLTFLESKGGQEWSEGEPPTSAHMDDDCICFANMFQPGWLGYCDSSDFYRIHGLEVVRFSDLQGNLKGKYKLGKLWKLFRDGEFAVRVDNEDLVLPFLTILQSKSMYWVSGKSATYDSEDICEEDYFFALCGKISLGSLAMVPHVPVFNLSTIMKGE